MPRELDELEPFVGQWRMTPSFVPDGAHTPRATASFEWLSGHRYLIQRWDVEHPDAPDGIAIIGPNAAGDAYLQHYFDSRGVERLYDMAFTDDLWTLVRLADAPDFSQRFVGRFDESATSIVGAWERSDNRGASWTVDFELTYTKVH